MLSPHMAEEKERVKRILEHDAIFLDCPEGSVLGRLFAVGPLNSDGLVDRSGKSVSRFALQPTGVTLLERDGVQLARAADNRRLAAAMKLVAGGAANDEEGAA